MRRASRPTPLPVLESADDVSRTLARMYGSDLRETASVLHAAAVWSDPDGEPVTMKINAETPRSHWDFFVLHVARARSDAIVTTGKILREEPDLSHAPPKDVPWAPALNAWRRAALDRDRLPHLVVLTRRPEIDWRHPALHGPGGCTILAPPQAADRLRPAARGVDIVGHPHAGIRAAVEYLHEDKAAETVLIEAGSSTATDLYQTPARITELMLSTFAGTLPNTVRGPPFVPMKRIATVLPQHTDPFEVDEASGQWTFQRRWSA